MRKDVRIYIYCAATSSILDDSKLLYFRAVLVRRMDPGAGLPYSQRIYEKGRPGLPVVWSYTGIITGLMGRVR